METQYISLNMTPTGVNPCFHISQYDVGRMLGFIVHSGGATVDLDTYTCTVEATRSDGTAITSAVATTDNIGTFEVTPTMSNKADKYRCQLIIVDENSKRIASLPFDMEVTKAAMDENSEAIEEDASLYQQYTEAVQGAIAEANADIQVEENARIAAVNAEATARQNANATLQNNIDAEATARQTADNTLQGNINSEASTRALADSNLQSQINQIVAPSGEAPSAAEVQNARIGADGVTYSTLGEAIRTNDSNIKAINGLFSSPDSINIMYGSEMPYEIGSMYPSAGGFTYSANSKRVRLAQGSTIKVKKNSIVGLTDYTGHKFTVGVWTGAQMYTGQAIAHDYIVPVDGVLSFLVVNDTEVDLTDGTAQQLMSLFFIKNENGFDNRIIENESSILNLAKNQYNSLSEISGNLIPFEIGTINIQANQPWQYNNSPTRIRTPEGFSIYLHKNDIIGLTSYTDARFALGIKDDSGVYRAPGWQTTNYTCPVDGNYVFIMSNNPEKQISRVSDLQNLLFIKTGQNRDYVQNNKLSYATRYLLPISIIKGTLSDATGKYTESIKRCTLSEIVYANTDYIIRADWNKIGIKLYTYTDYFGNGLSVEGWKSTDQYIPAGTYFNLIITNQDAEQDNHRNLTDNDVEIIKSNLFIVNDEAGYGKLLWNRHLMESSKTIHSVAHRGYQYFAPENTIPAFREAKKRGFKQIEIDIQYTSDGVPVIIHDYTINRTARNEDGSQLSDTVYVNQITYEDVLEYDFGIYAGDRFAGTKIPTFEQYLQFAKSCGIEMTYLDMKAIYGTRQQTAETLYELICKYGMQKNFTFFCDFDFATEIQAIDSSFDLMFWKQNLDSEFVQEAMSYKNANNHVTILVSKEYYGTTEEALCVAAKIPVMIGVYTSHTTPLTIANTSKYATLYLTNERCAEIDMYYEQENG